MTDSPWREISLTRTGPEEYVATNARGASLRVGSGSTADFSPVELLLVAIAGCSSVDVDLITSRRAEPTRFDVVARGEKLNDERGNHMGAIEVTFVVEFPEGPEGDQARERLAPAVAQSRDRLCTVSRTVSLGAPVSMTAR